MPSLLREISGNFTDRKFDTVVPQVVAFCCQNSADKTLQQALLFSGAAAHRL